MSNFTLKPQQKKLLDKFVRENLDKIAPFGFDVIDSIHAGVFPVELMDRLEAIKNGDFFQIVLNAFVRDLAYGLKTGRIK